ncbi:MAG: hypothetical protein NWR12_04005 [Haliea sp.]|jgi:hypothetical protein|nr:hypothetical protein [Haliea sp.]
MKIQRMTVMKLHAFLACLFLPMATLFFISGALYSLDIKGGIDKKVYNVTLDSPFSPDLVLLSELAKVELDQLDLPQPNGDPTIKAKKGSYEYRWGDLKYLVEIHPTDNPLEVELTYRERSPLAQVMRVHRAEAGSVIKVFSVSMAISLLIILASGVFLAVGLPKLRRNALLALALGVAALVPVFM